MQRHCAQVRARARELSAKAYWNQFKQSPEYVVMFLPGEAFLYAAVELDGSLIEDCTVDGFTGSVAGPGNGIVVGNDSTVRGCNSRFNAGDGIRATGQLNRIEGNRSYNNGSNGFEVVGGGNVCMQNTAGFNTAGNYAIPGGNNCPVITGTSGATNPFANVQ